MKILILGYFEDNHSAVYINDSFIDLGHEVAHIDTRKIYYQTKDPEKTQIEILDKVSSFKEAGNPNIILVLKGLELSSNTLKELKNMYPHAKLINWFFDIYIGTRYIWDAVHYHDIIKQFDYYFCSCKACVTKLSELGLTNVYWLPQGCFPEANGEVYLNNYQKRLYGSDVAFMGTIGYFNIHKTRLKTLTAVANAGFDFKVYGDVLVEPRTLPSVLKPCITNQKVINEQHSMVCQASKIILGVDAEQDFELSNSVRLYKVMCAGGLMLNSATNNLNILFNINKKGEEITPDLDLVVYYNDEDLIEKLDFLLEHEDIRKQIAKNGQKKVLEQHKYEDRLIQLLDKIQ